MRQHWDDAAASYFDPPAFQLALQSCVTVARTVTFILQSNKREIPNFEVWYSVFQEKWGEDPIMRWARDARNSIEKQGDLGVHSQVKATIVASYMDGPETNWVPQALFLTPMAMYRTIPARFFIPHIREHGTLLIERRWVDKNLPDLEVLEALAIVYERLAEMVLRFFKDYGLAAPTGVTSKRPEAMASLAMDRALYLSMRDGSPLGMRIFYGIVKTPDERQQRRVERRYGTKTTWQGLRDAKSLREVAEIFFRNARALMQKDGHHRSFAFLARGPVVFRMIRTDHPARAYRYVIIRDLAKLAVIERADGVMLINEAWTAAVPDIPKSGFAVDASNRGEAIVLNAANANGYYVSFEAEVKRRRLGRRVKAIGPTIVDEEALPFILLPFMREWGCMDDLALEKALGRYDEMGIETPTIPPENDGGGTASANEQ
jgi:hypothetical protein